MASVDDAPPNRDNFVLVKSILPRQPLFGADKEPRPVVVTERLIIRPFSADDLAGLYALRTQPEVMIWTLVGSIDPDLATTEAKLKTCLPGAYAGGISESFNNAIIWRETGELIGSGGVHNLRSSFGWPELGYMFKKEFWGKGVATEFVRAFLRMWEALPRVEAEIKVDARSLAGAELEGGNVREQLIAVTADENHGSQGVLRKCGFELIIAWKDNDSRIVDRLVPISLSTFRYFPKPVQPGEQQNRA
ncbi:GNAT domain-containing protein [Lasiosphaeris hirsuta]|uniref:GNAT domain-containing protein n=1 Tax=Lasiosphaeris hirsuta TaxID=260670 RepID=A0AA40BBY0_9PEZI|nr:GNAT domain-containing protein [Lasiosphaeris hirsuta]